MKDILHQLYYGRISGWERRPVRTPAEIAVNKNIEAEKRYFETKMSNDDFQRLQALENLYMQAHEYDEIDTYTYGFKMGVMLMCTVFADDGGPFRDME